MENYGVKYGTILSLTLIVIVLLLYFLNPELMFSSFIGFGSFILLIGGMVWAVSAEKKDAGGYIEFMDAFKTTLIFITIISLVSNFFNYVLFNFIDPGLYDLQYDKTIETMSKLFSEDNLEEWLEVFDKEELKLTLGKTMLYSAIYILIGAVIGLIVSLIMSKSKPDSLKTLDID